MKDYAHGALEAVAWTLGLIEEGQDLRQLRRRLEDARDDLLAGVSVNFGDRLRRR